jgi:hypothetical protein
LQIAWFKALDFLRTGTRPNPASEEMGAIIVLHQFKALDVIIFEILYREQR